MVRVYDGHGYLGQITQVSNEINAVLAKVAALRRNKRTPVKGVTFQSFDGNGKKIDEQVTGADGVAYLVLRYDWYRSQYPKTQVTGYAPSGMKLFSPDSAVLTGSDATVLKNVPMDVNRTANQIAQLHASLRFANTNPAFTLIVDDPNALTLEESEAQAQAQTEAIRIKIEAAAAEAERLRASAATAEADALRLRAEAQTAKTEQERIAKEKAAREAEAKAAADRAQAAAAAGGSQIPATALIIGGIAVAGILGAIFYFKNRQG